MKLGIIGNGVVGSATAHAFREGNEVLCWDKDPARSTHQLRDVIGCDLAFVCLPTPALPDGRCDTRIIERLFKDMGDSNVRFVLRSTVPVGFTRLMSEKHRLPNLCHFPEFLSARTAKEDAANPTRVIVGTANPSNDSFQCGRMLVQLCINNLSPTPPVFWMTSDESEAVKLFQNAFSACKVSVFNEFRAFADKRGLEWNRVLEALLAGGWVNQMHTQAPGHDGFGYAGSCLPKDLASLERQMQDDDLLVTMLTASRIRNEHDRGKNT